MNNIPTRIIKKITKQLRDEYTEKGVKIVFDHKNKYLDDEVDCEASAYFLSEPIPLIKISTVEKTSTEVLLNFIHETCHADQWLKQYNVWQECFIDGIDVGVLAQIWIDRKIELNNSQKLKIFDPLVQMEWNAEKYTCFKIELFKLHEWIDIEQYSKQARSYINGYRIAQLCRKWIPANNPPYEIDEIVQIHSGNIRDPLEPLEKIVAKYAKHYPEIFPGSWFAWEPHTHEPLIPDNHDSVVKQEVLETVRSLNQI